MDLNNKKHLEMLREVSRQLGDIGELVVYLGGSVAGLFITDPAADQVRATDDVDLVADVNSRPAFWDLEGRLRNLGFVHDKEKVCRWYLDDLLVDLMPPESGMVGTDTNRWFRDAIDNSREKWSCPGFPDTVLLS
jgi:hypothetical protein